MAVCNIHKLKSKSIYFVLDFPQAGLDVDSCMKLPIGFVTNEAAYGESCSYVIKLNKCIYSIKQAYLNWYEKLRDGLIARTFMPSVIDPCFLC